MKTELIEEVKDVELRFDQSLVVLRRLKQEISHASAADSGRGGYVYSHRNYWVQCSISEPNQNAWMVLLADQDSYYANDVFFPQRKPPRRRTLTSVTEPIVSTCIVDSFSNLY